jgi:tetratricopeptide (TPR) repeat protein
VRLPAVCLALSLVLAGVSLPRAQGLSARSWEDCLKAPDRACVLDEAIALLYLQDRTDRRLTVVATVAETWARAGEIDRAARLAPQVPDRLLARIAMLREIAAAQARASHREEAEAGFDRAQQLAYRWKDPMERAEALYAIALAQEAAGLKADAGITFDQALQAAAGVRIVGEKGRITFPEYGLAALLRRLAMRQAEAGEIAQALQIARSIAYDLETRARTLLAIADLQTRVGASPEATLDEALAAERDARSGMAQWPSIRDSGIRATTWNGSGNANLLCDIAKAQGRAGLTAKAVATLDEALRAARGIAMPDSVLIKRDTAVAGALARVADAQREVGLNAAARETLDRAALAAEATFGGGRADALAWLAEARTKAGDAAQDIFARALSIARALPNDFQRALSLMRIAHAQVGAGLRDEGIRTFAEAAGFARANGRMLLGDIANAQQRAGLMTEAAATFEIALSAAMSQRREREDGRRRYADPCDCLQRPRNGPRRRFAVAWPAAARSRRHRHGPGWPSRDAVRRRTSAAELIPVWARLASSA